MQAAFFQTELSELIAMVENGQGHQGEQIETVPASNYLDANRLADEQKLFKRLPLIVGHRSLLAKVGDFFVMDIFGISWLFSRDENGVARAFYNYCQHRGTRLVQEGKGCARRFSCPYHAWTYNLQGQLVGVPSSELFPNLDRDSKSLKAGHLIEQYGFLWLIQDADYQQPLDTFLSGFEKDLSALNLDSYSVYFNCTRPLKANWKLPLDAFLESYHISVLHKESIGSFFVRNVAYSDTVGPHIRSLVPRSNILDIKSLDWQQTDINNYVTPTYILFPNACFIFHPTSVSLITLYPGTTAGSSSWNHLLLVPKKPETAEEKAHYDKTIEVLDGMTFEREDFWVSEQIQQGLNAGAIDEVTLGLNEQMIARFHQNIETHTGANSA